MVDLDSFLTSLYVLVDDWWRANHSSTPRRPGRPALLADPEVLTLVILAQWPRFRSERDFWRFARAHLGCYFPNLWHPGPVQPTRACPGARDARVTAGLRRGDCRAFSRLPRLGHDPDPRDREGLPQGAVRRPSLLRAQRVEDRVGLRLQGGAGGGPRGGRHRFRPGPGSFGRETHRGRAHSV
jgi:hypothetical protein